MPSPKLLDQVRTVVRVRHLSLRTETASTQTVALSAILFLYRDVLKRDLPHISDIERAKPSRRLPVVFSRAEVQAVLARLVGTNHLIASLLYGAGLDLMEAIRLRGRVKVVRMDGEANHEHVAWNCLSTRALCH